MGIADRDYVRNKGKSSDEQIDSYLLKRKKYDGTDTLKHLWFGVAVMLGVILVGLAVAEILGYLGARLVADGASNLAANRDVLQIELEYDVDAGVKTLVKTGWKYYVGYFVMLLSWGGYLISGVGVLGVVCGFYKMVRGEYRRQ